MALVVGVRHAAARYGQKKTLIRDAHDLTPDGIHQSVRTAHELARYMVAAACKRFRIYSSPYARCLQTGWILAEEMLNTGAIPTVSHIDGIVTFDRLVVVDHDLEEVKQFDFHAFKGLVEGGGVTYYSRGRITLDQNITNPSRLGLQEYYLTSAWKNIPTDYLSRLSHNFKQLVDTIEEYHSVRERFRRRINELKRNLDESEFVILVTHQVCLSAYAQERVPPGTYVVFE